MAKNFANIRNMERQVRAMVSGTVAITPVTSLQSHVFSSYAVDSLPPAGLNNGRFLLTSDGASGSPIPVMSNSAFWMRTDTGSAAADGA